MQLKKERETRFLTPHTLEALDAFEAVQTVVNIFAAEFASQFGVENVFSCATAGVKEIFTIAVNSVEEILDRKVITVGSRIRNRRQKADGIQFSNWSSSSLYSKLFYFKNLIYNKSIIQF
jgi:hypothetical protein